MDWKSLSLLARTGALVVTLGIVAAACGDDGGGTTTGTPTDAGEDRPKVAALFTQFVDQGNWDPAGNAAFTAMCEKYEFDCTHVEEASYEQAPALLRDFAEDGYDMVITHSSGYSAAIEEVAPDYPDTEFVLFSWAMDTKGLDNYSAWSMDWDQYGYVTGAIAALSTDEPVIGVVAGEPIPSTKRTIALIQQAVADLEPDTEVVTTYIGSWTDAAKAKELALAQISDGAGFVIPVADTAGTGVKQAAEEQGVLSLGEYIDEAPQFPAVVTSLIVDMDGAYDEIGQAFVDGDLKGQIVEMNVGKGDLTLIEPFQHVDPAVQEEVNDLLDGLADGSIKISID